MKKLILIFSAMVIGSLALATDVGVGIDKDTTTKFSSKTKKSVTTVTETVTDTDYQYIFVEHKWKPLLGLKTKLLQLRNATEGRVKYNELKLSMNFKFLDDTVKVSPYMRKRFFGSDAEISESAGKERQNNVVIEVRYSF
jgi:hypothetical protein